MTTADQLAAAWLAFTQTAEYSDIRHLAVHDPEAALELTFAVGVAAGVRSERQWMAEAMKAEQGVDGSARGG